MLFGFVFGGGECVVEKGIVCGVYVLRVVEYHPINAGLGFVQYEL